MSGSSHILDTQVLGLTQGRETALDGCRAMWTNRRSVGSPDSPLQEHLLRGLLPSYIEEDRLRPHLWMPVFPKTAHPYTRPAYSDLEQIISQFVWKSKKTSNSQSDLEKEEWNWRNQPAWLQALLQSHSHQDSMVLAQRQKYRSMEQNRKPRDKSTHIWTPYLWQRRQEFTMD